MNTIIKNLLGVMGLLLFAGITYAAVITAGAYARNSEPSAFRTFQVTATGKAVGKPDIAAFTYSIISEGGTDLAALQARASKKSAEVMEFVKGNGIADEDVQTEAYAVTPRYQYERCDSRIKNTEPCPPPEIVGYTIRETVRVKVRDFEKVGTLLSGIVNAGANSVSSLSFEIDDPEELEMRARTDAIHRAQKKARQIAHAAGFSLGDLVGIDEGYAPVPVYRSNIMREAVTLSENAAPQIEPGAQNIQITVTLTYEIR